MLRTVAGWVEATFDVLRRVMSSTAGRPGRKRKGRGGKRGMKEEGVEGKWSGEGYQSAIMCIALRRRLKKSNQFRDEVSRKGL